MPLLKTCHRCDGLASTMNDYDTGAPALAYCPQHGGASTIEAWNTRAREDRLETEIAELRAALLAAFAGIGAELYGPQSPSAELGCDLGIDPALIRRAGYVEPPPPVSDCACSEALPAFGLSYTCPRCGEGWSWRTFVGWQKAPPSKP